MRIFQIICLTLFQLLKQVWLLPKTLATSIKQRQRQIVLNESKIERLDRIRNPSKYLGKP